MGKINENGLRNRDRTISGHNLPHTEVRAGRAALNTEEKGQLGSGALGLSGRFSVLFSFLFSVCKILMCWLSSIKKKLITS